MMMMTTNYNLKSIRKKPRRTCIACNEVKNKQELIRLVRTSDDCIEVDIGGKKAGRGAYLCTNEECWNIAIKGNRLERRMKVRLSEGNKAQLGKFGGEIQKEYISGQGR